MKLPFLPFYGRDFMADTARLDRTLKSVYMDLLWYMWEHADETGRPTLPDDAETISSMLGCEESEWARWRSILTRGKTAAFLTVQDGELSQKRLTEEWDKAMEFHQSKSAAGKKGADSRWNNGTAIADDGTAIDNAIANDGYTHTHPHPDKVVCKSKVDLSPAISALSAPERVTETALVSTNGKPKQQTRYSPDFEQFWDAYPPRRGIKAGKFEAWKAWQKANGTRPDAEALVAVITDLRQCDQWREADGRYIPLAATWLNGRNWETEVRRPRAGGAYERWMAEHPATVRHYEEAKP